MTILELCSGSLLTQKQSEPLKFYFGDLLSMLGPVFNLGWIILHCWGKASLSRLPNAAGNVSFPSRNCSQLCVGTRHGSLGSFGCFLSWWVISCHVWADQFRAECSGGTSPQLWGSFCLCSSLLSVFCPRTPASLVFPGSALFPHLKDSTRLRLDLFFLQHGQETLKAKAGATAGSPRVISFLRDRCLLSHLLKTNVSCVLSCLSVVSDGKVNLVPDSLSWLEAHQLHFKLWVIHPHVAAERGQVPPLLPTWQESEPQHRPFQSNQPSLQPPFITHHPVLSGKSGRILATSSWQFSLKICFFIWFPTLAQYLSFIWMSRWELRRWHTEPTDHSSFLRFCPTTTQNE